MTASKEIKILYLFYFLLFLKGILYYSTGTFLGFIIFSSPIIYFISIFHNKKLNITSHSNIAGIIIFIFLFIEFLGIGFSGLGWLLWILLLELLAVGYIIKLSQKK